MRETLSRTSSAILLLAALVMHLSAETAATPVNFSGTVSYDGSHTGDTLYVAVLDTTGVEDVTVLDLEAYAVGSSPFAQPYSLDFDNAAVAGIVLVASFLDTDGGGVDSVSGLDVFGWYDGQSEPVELSPSSSLAGLDFELPKAEISGTITFTSGQGEARIDASTDPTCVMEGFRPGSFANATGPYSIVGLYPGTYCISADAPGPGGQLHVCHGDPECVSPTAITLTKSELRTGVDLDFSALSPVEALGWGRIKALYR